MTSRFATTLLLCALLGLAPIGLGGCGDDSDADSSAGTLTSLSGQPSGPAVDPWVDAPATKIRFDDMTAEAGMTAVNHSGRAGVKEFLIEAVGPGCCWLDYDGDGFLDLYVPDGDVFSNYDLVHEADPSNPSELRALLREKTDRKEIFRDQLWRNNGDGTFTDVALEAGIDEQRWSFGATAFDYDADGLMDIFVANFGPNRLYRNNGNGTFTDIAEKVGVLGDPAQWSTCVGVADVDGDDRLDLYVAAYSDPAAEVERMRVVQELKLGVPVQSVSGRACRWRAIPAYCGPIGLVGQHDNFYRQMEDGTFDDLTVQYGLRPRIGLYAFTSLIWDFNEDGLLDIYVANDSIENTMWQQERTASGQIRFRDTSDTLGIKYGRQITPQASMGMSAVDIDQDGRIDIFITNFSHDYNNVHVQKIVGGQGGAVYYKDRGLPTMGQQVYYDLSWGCGWYDFDNDGDLDLYVANGHVYKEIDLFAKTGAKYDQLNALFENMDPKSIGMREIGTKAQQNAGPETNKENLDAGDGMAVARCSRQACFGDFDNDGRMDVVVLNMNEAPTVLRNTSRTGPDANWVKLSLRQPGGNREALGAFLEVTAGGKTQRMAVIRQKSFLGCDDPREHFGLGSATDCTVRVIWPGADREATEFGPLEAGAWYVLDRATGNAEKQALPQFK